MGDLFDALGFVNATGLDHSKDEDLRRYVEKLANLSDIIEVAMGSFIKEIHVAPANIINIGLKNLKNIEFHILYDDAYNDEDRQSLLDDCEEIVKAAVDSELEDVILTKVKVYDKPTWKVPTFCLYSDSVDRIGDLDSYDEVGAFLDSIRRELNIGVSISSSSLTSKCKSVILHVEKSTDIVSLKSIIENRAKQSGIRMTASVNKANDVYYTMIVGLQALADCLPYKYYNSEKV